MLKVQVYETLKSSGLLAEIVEDRIYSKLLPKNCTYPAVTYQRVTDITKSHLKGLNPEKGRFQFSLYAEEEIEVEKLFIALKKTLVKRGVFLSSLDGYESDTELHTIKADYSIMIRKV